MQQVQLPLETAAEFFGPGDTAREIRVRVYMPPSAAKPIFERDASISVVYKNGTRRINGFPELGGLAPGFLFFEETEVDGVYDFWWQTVHPQVVAAKFDTWDQGQNSQHGRGRLIAIVDAPVSPRFITNIHD